MSKTPDTPVESRSAATPRKSPSASDCDSREKILDVAEALFARRGFTGVGLREVAERSGLSKSSLFHHFRSKEELYFEVLSSVLARIEKTLAPVFEAESDPASQLRSWVEALIDALAEYHTTARLLLRGLFEDDDWGPERIPARAEAESTLDSILAKARGIVQRGVDEGVFRNVSVPHTLQSLIGATVYHFASGEIGEALLGGSIFSSEEVRRRKQEMTHLLDFGLARKSTS
jgi:AcrR family transcriptional regulator